MNTWRLRLATPLVAVLAFVASVAGIRNLFTYDDRYIIELAPAMHTLHGWWDVFQSSYWSKAWGGDGYRPLTLLAFRIEWVIGGGNAAVFHAVNIALYVAASVLVFALARRMLPTWAAWVAAALFAVHPVHVEAVANVVGQSELAVAVAFLVALVFYIDDRKENRLRPRTAAIVAAAYAVACFAKEHGIVLPALLVAAELTIIADSTPLVRRARELAPLYVTLAIIAVVFVGVRSSVLSDHGLGGFQPFTPFRALHIGSVDRILTAVTVVPQWFRLLLWPARLSSEYGPPEIEIAQGPSLVQLPGLLLLVGTVGIAVALRKRQPVISFGVAFAAIALAPSSNFLLPAGIVLAERTLFLPSVGAMLVVGAVAILVREQLTSRYPRSRVPVVCATAVCASLLLAGSAWSVMRTRVWHDNDRLFRQAVVDSPRAYRAHFMLGAWAFENKRKREGEAEYRKALSLFPYDPFLSYSMAEQYRNAGSCGSALPLYKWTHDLDPSLRLGHTMYAWCLLQEGQFADGRKMAVDAYRFGGDPKLLNPMIAYADSVLGGAAKKSSDAVSVLAKKAPSKVPDSLQKAAQKGGRGLSAR